MRKSNYLYDFVAKMKKEGIQALVIDTFSYYYEQLLKGEVGLVYDKDISPVDPHEIENYKYLSQYSETGKHEIKHTVSIVLNGGLGTSMGLTGPKSLIVAKNGKSFLEMILRRAEKDTITLALLNSFSTHKYTQRALSEINPARFPLMFLQHKFPKVLQKDYSPASWPKNPELEWNPPGHGDIYLALYASGMLQDLIDQGIIYAFISNSDNLGARMDASLLGYFAKHRFPFMMEVAEKTPADVKGGHIARHKNGRLILREAAQCPRDELNAFQDIQRYRYFNTNNIWINLKALNSLLDEHQAFHLPIILNPKTVDPRDVTSPQVFQIETAMGAAIAHFEGASAVKVPRYRFFPVKACNELLALRSDFFVITEKENLAINSKRMNQKDNDIVKIKLAPQYYGKIDDLDKRFSQGPPSLLDCESLTVEGDVRFEANVIIKGAVTIKNSGTSQAVIKAGTVIDQDLIL